MNTSIGKNKKRIADVGIGKNNTNKLTVLNNQEYNLRDRTQRHKFMDKVTYELENHPMYSEVS